MSLISSISEFYQNARAGFKYWDGTKGNGLSQLDLVKQEALKAISRPCIKISIFLQIRWNLSFQWVSASMQVTFYQYGHFYHFSGRLGVKVDRSYTNGSTNYHYWSSFESKMTPIGSGKILAEIKRHYWCFFLFLVKCSSKVDFSQVACKFTGNLVILYLVSIAWDVILQLNCNCHFSFKVLCLALYSDTHITIDLVIGHRRSVWSTE